MVPNQVKENSIRDFCSYLVDLIHNNKDEF